METSWPSLPWESLFIPCNLGSSFNIVKGSCVTNVLDEYPVMTKRLKEFKYFSPTTVGEAVSALKGYDGEAKVLAGGTDLLPMMKLRTITLDCIVSLKRIVGLDYIRL